MVRAGGGGERPRWPETGRLRAPTSRANRTIPRLRRTLTNVSPFRNSLRRVAPHYVWSGSRMETCPPRAAGLKRSCVRDHAATTSHPAPHFGTDWLSTTLNPALPIRRPDTDNLPIGVTQIQFHHSIPVPFQFLRNLLADYPDPHAVRVQPTEVDRPGRGRPVIEHKRREFAGQTLDRLQHELCPIPCQHRKCRSTRIAGPADVPPRRYRHGRCHPERVAVETERAMSLTMRFGTIIRLSVRIRCEASRPSPTFDQTHPPTATTADCRPPPQPVPARPHRPPYIAFTISSTIFFASENSIMVLSRKNSSFSMPA